MRHLSLLIALVCPAQVVLLLVFWETDNVRLHLLLNVKVRRLSHRLAHCKVTYHKGEATICYVRLLSSSRQVGAHLWCTSTFNTRGGDLEFMILLFFSTVFALPFFPTSPSATLSPYPLPFSRLMSFYFPSLCPLLLSLLPTALLPALPSSASPLPSYLSLSPPFLTAFHPIILTTLSLPLFSIFRIPSYLLFPALLVPFTFSPSHPLPLPLHLIFRVSLFSPSFNPAYRLWYSIAWRLCNAHCYC